MKPYWQSSDGEIYHGHVLEVLKELPDESVHMCVTSPPYWGLRDYGIEPQIWDDPGGCDHVWACNTRKHPQDRGGKYGGEKQFSNVGTINCENGIKEAFRQRCDAWKGSLGLEPTPELFIKHMVQVFAEVKRVLRNDGVIFVNIGDSYNGSGGSHKPEHLNPGISNSAVRSAAPGRNVNNLKPKDLVGIPWMLAFALRADGWYLRSDIIWNKPNPMPESCKDRPTKAHEYMFLLTKSAKYYYDCEAIREPLSEYTKDCISKTNGMKDRNYNTFSKEERFTKGQSGYSRSNLGALCNPSGRNKRTVWTIATEPTPEAHFATFPKKLVEPCILAGTSERGCCVECGAPWKRVVEISKDYHRKPGYKANSLMAQKKDNMTNFYPDSYSTNSKTTGWEPGCDCNAKTEPCTVMDIFMGSGKSALVAMKHGRRFIGIELSIDYLKNICIPKIEKARRQRKLF